ALSTRSQCSSMACRWCARSSLTLAYFSPPATPAIPATTTKTTTLRARTLFLQPVDGIDHDPDRLQIWSDQAIRPNFARLHAPFAQVQNRRERSRIQSESRGRPADNVTLRRRRILSMQNQCMPEQDAKRRERVCQQPPQQIGIGKNAGCLLPQTKELRPKVLLHLCPGK